MKLTVYNTCGGCPTQYEGRTEDGRRAYIRYRWGALRLDIEGETQFWDGIGDEYDGCLSDKEVTAHLAERGYELTISSMTVLNEESLR